MVATPIVVTYFSSNNGQLVNPLLAIPVFKGCSTAMNIYNLILNKLNQLNVPILNCIAFASNAEVMKNLMFNF